MKKPLFLGANWKMHPIPEGALDAGSPYESTDARQVVVFPMVTEIPACIEAKLIVGVQCGHAKDSGAFTGDIPMKTLKVLGCSYVLCGHSERRQYHGETDVDVAAQVGAALRCGLIPILCIGETEEERASGTTHEVLKRQLSHALRAHSSQLTAHNFLIAYEPVWAIGSGSTPSREDIGAIHAFIRSQLKNPHTRILYGGSLNPENAEEILSMPDVDGSLIGGASLKPEAFRSIGEIAARLAKG